MRRAHALQQLLNLFAGKITIARGAARRQPDSIVAAAIAQVEAGAEVFELSLDCARGGALPLPHLGVIATIIFVDVGAQPMAELRRQSFPCVLLARNILHILAAVGEVKQPQIIEPLRGRSIELMPNLVRDYAGEARVIRAS